MGWSNGWDNSYASYGPFMDQAIITYTNTGTLAQLVHSITMPLGTGLGTYTAGSTVTGDGSAITFYVTAYGQESSHVTVSNQVGVAGSPSYPPRSQMVAQTINFSGTVRVEPGATVSFLFASNTTQQGTSKVLVWDNENITGVVEDIPVVTNYTVTFKDWNGTVLKTETVASGGNATPPASPSRTGYTFSGWGGSYTNVTSNRDITATYTINTYTVTFDLAGGTRTGGGAVSQTVNYGSNATPPTCTRDNDIFQGWSGSYTNVTSNRTVTAQWESAAHVWKHISGSWQKVLFLKKMTGGSWTDLPALHNYNGGSWS